MSLVTSIVFNVLIVSKQKACGDGREISYGDSLSKQPEFGG